MKRILIGLTALSFILISCQKEPLDTTGNIQGMGNTPGDLQIKAPFSLPAGIKFIGEVTGIDNSGGKDEGMKSDDDAKAIYGCYGSGGKMIKLQLTLLNTHNIPRTVFFPKGLLWKCKLPGYQDAILLQTTWICLQPNTQRSIYLDLYCINHGLSPSDQNSAFQILGVTGSTVFNKLLGLIGWRKINYEMIFGTFTSNKGYLTEPTYEEITEKLQTIVWNLTNNGIDITSEDKAFIESIPELLSTEIPVLDAQSQFPEYFDEFVVPEK